MLKINGKLIIEHNKDKSTFLIKNILNKETGEGTFTLIPNEEFVPGGEVKKEYEGFQTPSVIDVIFTNSETVAVWIKALSKLEYAMKNGKFED